MLTTSQSTVTLNNALSQKPQIFNECTFLASLHHQNILHLDLFYSLHDAIVLVYEPFTYHALDTHLNTIACRSELTVRHVLIIMAQVAVALKAVHLVNYAVSDLSHSSILVNDNPDSTDPIVKIKIIPRHVNESSQHAQKDPKKRQIKNPLGKLQSCICAAPTHTSQSTTRKQGTIHQDILEYSLLFINVFKQYGLVNDIPDDIVDMLDQCMQIDPHKRCTMFEVHHILQRSIQALSLPVKQPCIGQAIIVAEPKDEWSLYLQQDQVLIEIQEYLSSFTFQNTTPLTLILDYHLQTQLHPITFGILAFLKGQVLFYTKKDLVKAKEWFIQSSETYPFAFHYLGLLALPVQFTETIQNDVSDNEFALDTLWKGSIHIDERWDEALDYFMKCTSVHSLTLVSLPNVSSNTILASSLFHQGYIHLQKHCIGSAHLQRNGQRSECQHLVQSVHLLTLASEMKDGYAMYILARMHMTGSYPSIISQNTFKAETYFKHCLKVVEEVEWLANGDSKGMVCGLSYLHLFGLNASVTYLQISAETFKNREAMYKLASLYEYGHVPCLDSKHSSERMVKIDIAKAMYWYEKAVEFGHDEARQKVQWM